MTILKPEEMARELFVEKETLKKYYQNDPDFPVIKIENTRRFIKEKVFEYLELKKKIDCVPNVKRINLTLVISPNAQFVG